MWRENTLVYCQLCFKRSSKTASEYPIFTTVVGSQFKNSPVSLIWRQLTNLSNDDEPNRGARWTFKRGASWKRPPGLALPSKTGWKINKPHSCNTIRTQLLKSWKGYGPSQRQFDRFRMPDISSGSKANLVEYPTRSRASLLLHARHTQNHTSRLPWSYSAEQQGWNHTRIRELPARESFRNEKVRSVRCVPATNWSIIR
jgi:hypothetical protein